MAAIVEKIHEVEDPDATFALFGFEREASVLIVGRSLREAVLVDKILAAFGGGGHECAASAYIKKANLHDITAQLQERLKSDLAPASSARELLFVREDLRFIAGHWTLREASIFLEEINATGSAVVDSEERLIGVLTLRDIMKGRKKDQMHAPVNAYMTRKVISVSLDTGVRKIERIIREHNIGHLPVIEDGRVVGIITRDKIIEFMRERNRREQTREENTRAALPRNKGDDEAFLQEE